ncbi:hypothetical protein POM88_000591 [Heracleum sosnowskyi]|uniref:Uncharacterized protein n=1 Tax=Heracleum sosnowskyi TaxID=360622 RepID=A0AAD8JC60_9APIA|nr:hypothetical protein POM88_000591 [Heracleum sosnowskyi]
MRAGGGTEKKKSFVMQSIYAYFPEIDDTDYAYFSRCSIVAVTNVIPVRCGTDIKTENLSSKSYLGTIKMQVMENLCCIHAPSVQILQLWKFRFKPSSSHITVSVTRIFASNFSSLKI